mmetsp:Transcript_41577/g.120492  ORF Transcript_41577/g.120492 Transcript_41577/m.120492 type:complete len:768 (+) Transcript_41577:662-2965(+)
MHACGLAVELLEVAPPPQEQTPGGHQKVRLSVEGAEELPHLLEGPVEDQLLLFDDFAALFVDFRDEVKRGRAWHDVRVLLLEQSHALEVCAVLAPEVPRWAQLVHVLFGDLRGGVPRPSRVRVIRALFQEPRGLLARELRHHVEDVEDVAPLPRELQDAELCLHNDLPGVDGGAEDALVDRAVLAVHPAIPNVALMSEDVDPQIHLEVEEPRTLGPVAHAEEPLVGDDDGMFRAVQHAQEVLVHRAGADDGGAEQRRRDRAREWINGQPREHDVGDGEVLRVDDEEEHQQACHDDGEGQGRPRHRGLLAPSGQDAFRPGIFRMRVHVGDAEAFQRHCYLVGEPLTWLAHPLREGIVLHESFPILGLRVYDPVADTGIRRAGGAAVALDEVLLRLPFALLLRRGEVGGQGGHEACLHARIAPDFLVMLLLLRHHALVEDGVEEVRGRGHGQVEVGGLGEAGGPALLFDPNVEVVDGGGDLGRRGGGHEGEDQRADVAQNADDFLHDGEPAAGAQRGPRLAHAATCAARRRIEAIELASGDGLRALCVVLEVHTLAKAHVVPVFPGPLAAIVLRAIPRSFVEIAVRLLLAEHRGLCHFHCAPSTCEPGQAGVQQGDRAEHQDHGGVEGVGRLLEPGGVLDPVAGGAGGRQTRHRKEPDDGAAAGLAAVEVEHLLRGILPEVQAHVDHLLPAAAHHKLRGRDCIAVIALAVPVAVIAWALAPDEEEKEDCRDSRDLRSDDVVLPQVLQHVSVDVLLLEVVQAELGEQGLA